MHCTFKGYFHHHHLPVEMVVIHILGPADIAHRGLTGACYLVAPFLLKKLEKKRLVNNTH